MISNVSRFWTSLTRLLWFVFKLEQIPGNEKAAQKFLTYTKSFKREREIVIL